MGREQSVDEESRGLGPGCFNDNYLIFSGIYILRCLLPMQYTDQFSGAESRSQTGK